MVEAIRPVTKNVVIADNPYPKKINDMEFEDFEQDFVAKYIKIIKKDDVLFQVQLKVGVQSFDIGCETDNPVFIKKMLVKALNKIIK